MDNCSDEEEKAEEGEEAEESHRDGPSQLLQLGHPETEVRQDDKKTKLTF